MDVGKDKNGTHPHTSKINWKLCRTQTLGLRLYAPLRIKQGCAKALDHTVVSCIRNPKVLASFYSAGGNVKAGQLG